MNISLFDVGFACIATGFIITICVLVIYFVGLIITNSCKDDD